MLSENLQLSPVVSANALSVNALEATPQIHSGWLNEINNATVNVIHVGLSNRFLSRASHSVNSLTDSTAIATNTSDSPSLVSSAIATVTDGAGNTLFSAHDLGELIGTQSVSDFVGASDRNDFYQFSLLNASSISLDLTELSSDADLRLIQDRNNDGIINRGEVLASSLQWGTTPEHIDLTLTPGKYYIQVYPYSGDTNYTLRATATPLVSSPYNPNYGYGLVNAAAAISEVTGLPLTPSQPDLGGPFWDLDAINAPEAWAQGFTGQGITIAVVDSGVDYTHPDLANNIWVNTREIWGNGIDDDGNGYVDDVIGWNFVDNDNNPYDLNGHGTHVAGTIAAENNGIGAIGVAYNAHIMPVRVLDQDGSGSWQDVAAGIYYAVNNGANIINLSLGGAGYSPDIAAAVQYATARGAFVVMAAGNEGQTQPDFPANLASQYGIAVGAVNRTNQLASFSNDAGAYPVNYVVAPGVGIYSTFPGNTYQFLSGTSMATPHVSGVAALVLSANPYLTPAQLSSILTSSATKTGITT